MSILDAIRRLVRRPPIFEVRKGPSGKWYVVELSGGRVSNTSETYASRSGARRAAKTRAERTPGADWRIRA